MCLAQKQDLAFIQFREHPLMPNAAMLGQKLNK
jgi:hypothetical protein